MAPEASGTLLVPVGANHKDDIERILAGYPGIEIVQPSSFGAPTAEEIEAALHREDLLAVASFNLAGDPRRTRREPPTAQGASATGLLDRARQRRQLIRHRSR